MAAGRGNAAGPARIRLRWPAWLLLLLLPGCVLPAETRRDIRLRASLGEEIDAAEMDDLLAFAWSRHINRESMDRGRAVREGIWLATRNLDPTDLAFDPGWRAEVVSRAGDAPGSAPAAIERIVARWNAVRPDRVMTFSEAAEQALDCIFHRLDPHSSFFARAEWTSLMTSISGEYSGIGVLVQHADEPVISEVFEEGPSDGILRNHDRIVAVDGREVTGMTSEQYLALIRGAAGTSVNLRIRRGSDLLEFTIVRRQMKARAVRRTLAGPGRDILVLRLWSYTDGSADQVAEALRKDRKPLRGVILDLRNNPGGTVDDAVAIVDLFIDRGEVITEQGLAIRTLTADTAGAAIPANTPLLVLVNRFSASAAELTAGALRDHGRAIVMGETTFGKGTVQEIYRFGDRGAKVTVARFYLPAGRSTQLCGVVPDIAFADSEAARSAAEGDGLFEREYDNAVPADSLPTSFRRDYDPVPLLARLRGRLGAGGDPDPELDADDAMLNEAVRALQREEPVAPR